MTTSVEIKITSNYEITSGPFYHQTVEKFQHTDVKTEQIPHNTPYPLTTPRGDKVEIKVLTPATPPQNPITTTFADARAIIVPTTQKAAWPWKALKISTDIVALCGTFGANKGLFGFLADNCKIASTYLAPLGGASLLYGGQKIVSVLSDVVSTNSMSTIERAEGITIGVSFCVLGVLSVLQTQKLCP